MIKWVAVPAAFACVYSSAWNLVEKVCNFCVPMTFIFALMLGYATVAAIELAKDV